MASKPAADTDSVLRAVLTIGERIGVMHERLTLISERQAAMSTTWEDLRHQADKLGDLVERVADRLDQLEHQQSTTDGETIDYISQRLTGATEALQARVQPQGEQPQGEQPQGEQPQASNAPPAPSPASNAPPRKDYHKQAADAMKGRK